MSTPLEPSPYSPYAEFAPPPEAPAVIDPDDPPWGVGAAFFTWLASVVLMVLLSALFTVGYLVFSGVMRAPGNVNATIQSDPNVTLTALVSMIPTHLATLGVVWCVVTNFGRRPFWRTVGWSWSPRFGFWTSVLLAICLLALSGALIYFTGSGVETPLEETIKSSTAARFLMAFLAVAGAPLVEELVYRGVLYPALRRGLTRAIEILRGVTVTTAPEAAPTAGRARASLRAAAAILRWLNRAALSILTFFQALSPRQGGVVWAVVLVGSLFTVVHVAQYYNNPAVIAAVGSLGFALTVVRATTGRVLPCFVIHLVFNGIQVFDLVLEYVRRRPDEAAAAAGALVSAAGDLSRGLLLSL